MLPFRPWWTYMLFPAIAFGLVVGFAYGVVGFQVAYEVAILAVLEISLSFDNAIVNARILTPWNETWRRIFMGPGIIVAVFGMRFGFPILVVAAAAHLSPGAVLDMAIHRPALYAHTLEGVHHIVAAFGGTFLLLLALQYFFDQEKDSHWLGPIEAGLNRLGLLTMAEASITAMVLVISVLFVPDAEKLAYLLAGATGIVVYAATKSMGTLVGGGEVGSKVIKAGIGGFIYLEVLDASFSFDGVIGAFAITNDILWIMAGLGVGAIAVRSLTKMAVDRGTLTEFPHLENGAFWAILALAIMMLISPIYDLPEAVKGLCGVGFIVAAFLTSIMANRAALNHGHDQVARLNSPLAWGDERDLKAFDPAHPDD